MQTRPATHRPFRPQKYNPLQNRPVRPCSPPRRTPPLHSPLSYGLYLQPPHPGRTPTQPQLATGACSNFPTEPFPGLPIGGTRAFPSLTVSAPSSSQNGILLQSRRDRRPPDSRPLRCSRRADVSPITPRSAMRQTSSRGLQPVSTCRTPRCHAPPPQAPLLSCFVIGPQFFGRVLHPHLNRVSVISDRIGDFRQSVHRLFRWEADLPLFQLAQGRSMHHRRNSNSCTPPGLHRRR